MSTQNLPRADADPGIKAFLDLRESYLARPTVIEGPEKPLTESARRKPEFLLGTPVRLGTGEVFHFPPVRVTRVDFDLAANPVVVSSRTSIPAEPDLDEQIQAIREAEGLDQYAIAARLAGKRLGRNYAIFKEEASKLFPVVIDATTGQLEPSNAAFWSLLMLTLTGDDSFTFKPL